MVLLDSPSKEGIYATIDVKGKKPKQKLIWEKCHIVDTKTGEVISKDIRPQFLDWVYEDYKDEFDKFISDNEVPPIRFLEPQFAFEPEEIIDDEIDYSIAELKEDGHRCLLYIGADSNRAFSRRISKKTRWFSENTDQLPHIRDLALGELYGTVLDGELKWGKDSIECQSIMGALPETAIQKQWETKTWARFECFDILYYKGVNVQNLPLLRRKQYLHKVINFIKEKYGIDYINEVKIYAKKEEYDLLTKAHVGHIVKIKSFQDLFKELVAKGSEGIIIKTLNGKYVQGKYSKDFLKMKAKSTWDCVMMGITDPEKEYTGKKLTEDKMNEWNYWEYDGEIVNAEGKSKEYMDEWFSIANPDLLLPVSKPYAMGWCGGLQFGVWKPFSKADYNLTPKQIGKLNQQGLLKNINGKPHRLVEVGTAKGLTEEIMIDLKKNWEEYVSDHSVIEVMANGLIDKEKGSLRHPRFHGWNNTKNHEQCTWNMHIRKDEK